MRYLGSKTLLLSKIAKVVEEYNGAGVFCDPFGGIGTVGNYMKKLGYSVITGDILNFAHYFQVALIENNEENCFCKLKGYLNVHMQSDLEKYLSEIVMERGWMIEEYATKRKFFTYENACHIQGCIDNIKLWKKEGLLTDKEYAILIASLIQSFDNVANTAGTYYAYLKEYYRKAKRPFKFKMLETTVGNNHCKSYLKDANELVKSVKCDILYLDPPYNERDYGRYYHLPETVSKGVVPKPSGKSGVFIVDNKKSRYNSNQALVAFEDLIQHANAKCIIFHYTDNGLINIEDARGVLKQKGDVEEFYFDCRGYNTTNISNKCQHHMFKVVV